MNKEEKVKGVEELKGQLNDYKSIYLTDIAGLDAMQTSKLRRECFNSNVKLSVVKNTFLERAMSESETDFVELKDLLKGKLNDYKSIYLTDIAGLDAMQTSNLRRECFNSNVKLSVVKNTFLERAMSESETDFGELKDLLKGNTTVMSVSYTHLTLPTKRIV